MVIRVVEPRDMGPTHGWHYPCNAPWFALLHDWKGVFWIDDGIAVHFRGNPIGGQGGPICSSVVRRLEGILSRFLFRTSPVHHHISTSRPKCSSGQHIQQECKGTAKNRKANADKAKVKRVQKNSTCSPSHINLPPQVFILPAHSLQFHFSCSCKPYQNLFKETLSYIKAM